MAELGQLVVAPFGPRATAALARAIRSAQSTDPLAPVDVVVPTAAAGVLVRRAVAGTGLANVRFSLFDELAERLAARHLAVTGRRPLRSGDRAVATRTALRSTPGPLSTSAARHQATADGVEGVLAELDAVDANRPGFLDRLESGSERGLEVTQIFRTYRAHLAAHPEIEVEVADAAVEALAGGDAPATHVILFAPGRLLPGELRLLEALAQRGRLSAVVCVLEGDSADAVLPWLLAHLGPPLAAGEPTSPEVRIVVAPDAEEEVRLAVRAAVAHLESFPVRPERVAIAYRSREPYLRTLVQVLDESGLPFSAPACTTLAQTATGRLLTGLLALRAEGYPRADLIRWLSDAPVLDAGGRPVPAARWDRLSREARVSRGAPGWQARLDRFADAATQASTQDPAPGPAGDRRRRDGVDARALATMVAEIIDAAERAAAAPTWRAVTLALRAAVERFLGSGRAVERWRAHPDAPALAHRHLTLEAQAYDAVLDAVDGLAQLDGSAPEPDAGSVRQALLRALDRPAAAGTTLGRGVLVAPVGQLAGADVDLLLVVGMTEDSYPPRLREHPVLRDADRALVGVPADGSALLGTADRRAGELRDHRAALAGARKVVLSYAVADVRGQRRQFPSPWLLAEATRLAGTTVTAEKLPSWSDATWLTVHPSFDASLRKSPTAVSRHELDVALAHGGRAGLIADPRFRRGREAAAARSAAEFGPWLGALPPLADALLERAGETRSATALEGWATCPASYLFSRLLRVGELEDVGDQDRIDARERGTLVHRALERFLSEHVPTPGRGPRDPEAAWTPQEMRAAGALLDEEAALLEQDGVTGRPALWRAELSRLHRALTDTLTVDSALRRELRSWPVAVEMRFGRDAAEPLRLTLPDGREVAFAGSVDRVDRTQEGRLIVLDYKTGKGYGYDSIPRLGATAPAADLTDRGRKMQLALYALAAEKALGSTSAPAAVDGPGASAAPLAYYWFVEQGRTLRGGHVDAGQRQRLIHVLDVATDSVLRGLFPANPGEWSAWDGYASCRFCPYDRVCSTNRGETWEQLRGAAELAAYAALADGSDLTSPETATENREQS